LNLFGLSPGELLLIGLVAMIVLGPEKLPEVAASVGKWIREFRRATEELTSQFADENPFTEIQKALALDELLAPTVISTMPDAPAPAPVATPAIESPTPFVAPTIPQPNVAEKVKSYHFLGTPNHPGLDPEWVVGAPIRAEVAAPTVVWSSADDEWLHGVPVVVEEPVPSSDDITMNQILPTAAEVEVGDATTVPSDTNGHDSATSLEELVVEATSAEGESVEAVATSASAEVDSAEAPTDATESRSLESGEVAETPAPAEKTGKERDDVTLILEPAPEVRREEAHQEPAFVGGDAKGRISEEHLP